MDFLKDKRKLKLTIVMVCIVAMIVAGGAIWKATSMWHNMHAKLDRLLQQTVISEQAPIYTNIGLTVMGMRIEINPQINGDYSLPQLTTEFPVAFTFDTTEQYEITVDGQPLVDNAVTIQIPEIRLNSDPIIISCKHRATGTETMTKIRTFPSTFPAIAILGQSPQKGAYYFIAQDYLVKLNNFGTISFYKHENRITVALRDFRKFTTPDGEIRYSYMIVHDQNKGLTGSVKYIIMDEWYNVINQLDYMVTDELLTQNTANEGHDYYYFDDGHYLFVTYLPKRVYNIPTSIPQGEIGTLVFATVLQEVKDGKVLWEWDSTAYPELYAFSSNGNDYYYNRDGCDYMHFNSVDVDPKDGNYICSFRHQDAILKIDSKTGDIIWILGGKGDQFGLTDDQKFSHQHHARYTSNGTITLFDNANNTGFSRAMEFKLDEENKKLIWCKSYMPEHQTRTWMGSVQRLSSDEDTFLIGWGGRGGGSQTASNLFFSEINFTTKEVLFEAYCGTDNYRVYKYDS